MRLDQFLVTRGDYPSRARAQSAIRAGLVRVGGRVAKKASVTVPDGAQVEAEAEHPYVSRGGLKLAHGLAHFGVSAQGRVCLDIGSSTGGFTDVLLRAGAARVYAVDVGRDQLHDSLRSDPRVISMESQDARTIHAGQFNHTDARVPDLLVCDASFVSLTKILAVPMSLTREAVLLVKPQFEVGRENIGKGGLVRGGTDEALARVQDWARAQGWRVEGMTDSPITGGDGNREFVLHAVRREKAR